jgi:SAM-dependent methyltransferase
MSGYILGETAAETARLNVQARSDAVEERLRWAGLAAGMRAVDAGCGPGDTSRTLARLVGPTGSVFGFDMSSVRVDAARAQPAEAGAAPIEYGIGDVQAPPLPEGGADFVVCQWVLEYLATPEKAVAALLKLLKPGGILLIVDADGIGLMNWPTPPVVEQGLPHLVSVLAKTGFDPYVGRKLYSLAMKAGARDVGLLTFPYMQAAGPASPPEQLAWTQRFEALTPLGVQAFGSVEAWKLFTTEYLAMLSDLSTFKFILGVAVRGRRA